jgi:hypothetical protein
VPISSHRQPRARAFARLIGPWLVIAPAIILARIPAMGDLASEFFKSALPAWFIGAFLLFGALAIIAFHQYWSSLAAVLISLFGWILALRGFVLMAFPELDARAALAPSALAIGQLIYGILIVIGLYLTYLRWLTKLVSPSATTNP